MPYLQLERVSQPDVWLDSYFPGHKKVFSAPVIMNSMLGECRYRIYIVDGELGIRFNNAVRKEIHTQENGQELAFHFSTYESSDSLDSEPESASPFHAESHAMSEDDSAVPHLAVGLRSLKDQFSEVVEGDPTLLKGNPELCVTPRSLFQEQPQTA